MMKSFHVGLRVKFAGVFLAVSITPLLIVMFFAIQSGKEQAQQAQDIQNHYQAIIQQFTLSLQAHETAHADLLAWAKANLAGEQVVEIATFLEGTGARGISAPTADEIQQTPQQFMQEFEAFVKTREFFFIGLISGVIALSSFAAFWIGRALTANILRLTTIADQIARGEIIEHAPIAANDELGQLSRAFHRMTVYLKTMYGYSRQIAQGNIQKIPKPESPQDALGNAFYEMGRYLKNISDTAERISTGDFQQMITLKSEQDLLGEAFQRMTTTLADALRQVKKEVEIVGMTSQTMSTRADDEKRMVLEVLSSAEETSSSMMQMQASVEEVSENMSVLSHSIEETVSSIEEMNMSIKQIASNTSGLSGAAEETFGVVRKIGETITRMVAAANQAEQSSKGASDSANAGQASVKEIIEGMGVIQRGVATSAETIKTLGSRTEAIGSITDVISDIADQTSLLALNASIIAAQAGEHGRGFAVVAEEVKELAQRSSEAAKEIDALIQGIQKESQNAVQSMEEGLGAVENGVMLANRGGEALDIILISVQNILDFIAANAKIADEQAALSEQVGNYMENVLRMVTEITRATGEQQKGSAQVTVAVEQMRNLAEQVKRATVEQNRGTMHVLEAMDNVTQRVQESSERSQEIASFAAELASETATLSQLLRQFQIPAAKEARS